MNVFISYSIDDRELVHRIDQTISTENQVHYWDKSKEPGEESWGSIFKWIDEADVVLVLITDQTVKRAMSVGQEVGRAKSKGKYIIPLVQEGISASALGCLSGVTYELIPKDNPMSVLEKIAARLTARKKQNEDAAVGALAVVGLVALVALVAFKGEK